MNTAGQIDPVLELEGVSKSFGGKTVVDDISITVRRGEIFGFLGPNGSGKTTSIRMALGIIRPDAGRVSILGGAPKRDVLRRVGYLPEERGLLRKVRVMEIIRYLGRLKGLSAAETNTRGEELLHRVGLYQYRDKKVESLSRGMTQLVQFIAAIIHEPELIILDEPFAGLDPLNVLLMKEMLFEQQRRGATVMFSTHIMPDVEELCERVALISDSKMLLYGDLAAIKRDRGANSVRVHAGEIPPQLQNGHRSPSKSGFMEYTLGADKTPDSILRAYVDAGIPVQKFEVMLPTLNDIFIQEVHGARSVP